MTVLKLIAYCSTCDVRCSLPEQQAHATLQAHLAGSATILQLRLSTSEASRSAGKRTATSV